MSMTKPTLIDPRAAGHGFRFASPAGIAPGAGRAACAVVVPLAALLVLSACGGQPPVSTPAPAPSSAEPPPAPFREVSFPAYEERTLSNGARVIVVEDARFPMVSFGLRIRAGSAADPADKEGTADLVAELLTKGTATRSAEAIAQAIDFVGGTLTATAGADWTTITATVLSAHADTALALLADVVVNPTFPESELESTRTRTLSGLQVELSQPAPIAARRLARELYGEHPYGRSPTPASIRAVNRDDVADFHRGHFTPDNALFVVAGAMGADEAAGRLERHFAGWTGRAATPAVAPAPPRHQERRMVFVHQPGTVQAVIRVGTLLSRASEDEWVRLEVANQVLGGVPTGWLFNVLRNERGWTYGASSSVVGRRGPGFFQASTEVRNEVADSALAELLAQVGRLAEDRVPDSDLARARNFLAGSFPLRTQTPQQVANQHAANLLMERSADYLDRYPERVNATGAADLAVVARAQIRVRDAVIVVVGDALRLFERLSPLADRVELVDVQGRPVAFEDLAGREPAVLALDASRLRPGTRVYSLLVQGNPLGEATVTISHETADGVAIVRASQALASPMGAQEQSVAFTAADFRPIEALTSMGGNRLVELRMVEGRVRGRIAPPGQEPTDVDVEAPAGTLLSGMETYAIALSELRPGAELEFRVFAPGAGITPVTARVVGEATVEVPAGTFETFEVELSGQQAMRLFVRREAPHYVVKQEIVGQPVVIELKEIR